MNTAMGTKSILIAIMYAALFAAVSLLFSQIVAPLLSISKVFDYDIGRLAFICLVTSVVSCVVLGIWTFIEIGNNLLLSDIKRQAYKYLLLKPFNGPTIYFLNSDGGFVKRFLINHAVIISIYHVRNISFFLLLISLMLVAVFTSNFFFVAYTCSLLVLIITSASFELSVLTDIMAKHDDDLYAYGKYFRVFQWPLPYSDYYREIKSEL